uniref:Uncharacterized protein n=1 Tax=Kalanchoe fedtschenkoi TaxID=63787 RepID=A0A7N0TZJ8_KALFE
MTGMKLPKRKIWMLPLIFSLLGTVILALISISVSYPLFNRKSTSSTPEPQFVEQRLHATPTSPDSVPKLAYLISGSSGDGATLRRTLKALYHPRNQYAVHLDLEASAAERLELFQFVENDAVFGKVGNVRMVVRANLVTYRGPTMVSNTLHAAAILLREGGHWDWFINLSASDYPLVTQDDLLHVFSSIPRELNFIEHTSDISWKEHHRARPILIDPGLYNSTKSDVFWASNKRSMPTAFKLFTGSAWMMLSRPFMEYCLWGWDNLPRTVLMYYANFLSSPEGYFHTVICNADEFRNTTVNHDLHFISWDNPPKQHPHFLSTNDYQKMVDSNAPFARKFGSDEPVLDMIDSELLSRVDDGFVPGGWYTAEGNLRSDIERNNTVLKPGPGAERLKQLINSLINHKDFHSTHCV